MPRQRMGLPKWLRMQIDSRKYNGVKWVSREKLIFSIPWKHASSNKWTLQNDAALFKDWAIHKGKYNEGIDEITSQLAFTCSKLTIETLEQGVKYVRS